MKAQMIIRMDTATKERFERMTRSEGKSSSQVVRELMATYIVERDIAGSIDGLWDRIGAVVKSKGYGASDIARVVRQVRREKK